MSIIVKGIKKIPKSCGVCMFDDYGYCIMTKQYSGGSATHGRASFCPLVELPEKHGRLIDASKLKETLDYYIAEAGWGPGVNEVLGWVKEFIDSERTIVEQESEND